MLETVRTLWVGKVSPLERLCMRSFVLRGHPYHLYTYGEAIDVPLGVEVKDANEIVPKERIEDFQNLANFSDFFRFTMLLRYGGWWADSDVCCLKPFVFDSQYVFASQLVVQRTNDEITSCVIKVPSGSEMMQWCLNRIADTDTSKNSWSAIGPALLLTGHRNFKLQQNVKKHEVFCPLNYFEAPDNVFGSKSGQVEFGEDTFAVHLWNEESRRAKIDKYAIYPGSLYERLQQEMV